MSDKKTHHGGCHCGKVRFEIDADVSKVVGCNCSICTKRGWLLAFVMPEQFRLVSGREDELTDYGFRQHHIHHLFCPTCGVSCFSWGVGRDGQKMYSINVRCLDDIDLSALEVQQFDGRSL